MLKMILDPMGGIVITNDGNAILREVDVNHPAAKSMIELARTQDEEVGDGTTSVIILAGEMLQVAEEFLDRRMHPRVIVTAYNRALFDSEEFLKSIAVKLDSSKEENILKIVRSTIGTKFVSRYGDLICKLALKAVNTVMESDADVKIDEKDTNWEHTNMSIDIKRFARIEKIPGGLVEESEVLDGIMLNKDILHPKMKRRIENPRIICIDCPLEYNKGESKTDIEITKANDFEEYLRVEEQFIQTLCDQLAALKPDIVVTEKGCSELAQHFLFRKGISVLRRLKKTDNVRLARACGATIGHRVELLKEKDVGTGCGLFEVRSIADDYYSFFVKCKKPKACSIILRGGSKDVLQEMWRNLDDAMAVTKNILKCPKILPGGGATEMAVSTYLMKKSLTIEGSQAYPYKAVARALEVIPRTLIANCGAQPIRVLTNLRAKHAHESDPIRHTYGVNGETGAIVSMNDYDVWEPFVVKVQSIKTAIESASMLLRIDDVVSGIRNKEKE